MEVWRDLFRENNWALCSLIYEDSFVLCSPNRTPRQFSLERVLHDKFRKPAYQILPKLSHRITYGVLKGEIEERTSLKTIKSQFDQPKLLCDFCDEFVSHIGGKCSLGAERILTIFFHYKEQLLFDQQV